MSIVTGTITLPVDTNNTGKIIDYVTLTVSSNTVYRQNICLADPQIAGAIVTVAQFHNSDNQALGSGYGLTTGGISQVLNVNGNLDRAKGYQGDQITGTGMPLDVSMTAQVMPPTFASNAVTAGASKTINVPSTTGIKVGTLVQIELQTSAVVEWARVNALVANTSITVDNLNNAHTNPYPVFPVQFNTPRDAFGEQDLAGGYGATLAVDYNFDGSNYERARNAWGLGVYSDTSASNVSAGNNVTITTAGTPPTLASGVTLPCLIIDSANSKQELAIIISTNPGSKTITFQTLASAYNGSVTPLQVRAPTQSLLTAPVNCNGWGLAADLAMVFSGLDTNNVPQFSVEKDVNGAGLAPVQGAASAAGMDADINFAIYRTWANRFAVSTDKQLSPLVSDLAGSLQTGVMPLGTPIYAGSGASGGAAAANSTLTIPANKMGYLDGFDIDGLGATSGAAIAVTITGLLGGTLTFEVGIPAGVAVPFSYSKRFNPPLQASATGTNIVVNVPSFGTGNTQSSSCAFGHYV